MAASLNIEDLTSQEKTYFNRLRNDFEFYAEKLLVINTKEPKLIKFKLNYTQRYIHDKLEEQLRKTGRVRAIILKPRQTGVSSYAAARTFKATTLRKGLRSFILTHEMAATANIFGIVKRFYDNLPGQLKPSLGQSNVNAFEFDVLASGYRVGTAGAAAVGRSATIHDFLGSEVAYWPNQDDHVSGILQAVPDVPGSEIILESTSNGPTGTFYEMFMAAMRGENGYIAIFIPWYKHEEYHKKLPTKDFELTTDEELYKELYGLCDEQMYWRRMKIAEDPRGIKKFRREYPATVEEAFKEARKQALWKTDQIEYLDKKHNLSDLRKRLNYVIIGLDPALEDKENSDAHGIIVTGINEQGHGIILEDLSFYGSPTECSRRVISAYNKYNANLIAFEKNVAGKWVNGLVGQMGGPMIKLEGIHVREAKELRAEPAQALYEQHLIKHRYQMLDLEDEMTTWVPNMGMPSPNRLDALVLALTKLFETKYAEPFFY